MKVATIKVAATVQQSAPQGAFRSSRQQGNLIFTYTNTNPRTHT